VNILALSDRVVPYVYSPTVKETFKDIGLIVGCGDVPAGYLEYVVSQFCVPLIYVSGNHDSDGYHVPGGVDVDGKVIRVAGLTAAGLGGSRRYKREGRHQYTETEMHLRALWLLPRLLLRRLAHGHGLDVLVTHAPALGIHDADDLTHRGFLAFRRLLQVARPRLMLHGHVHLAENLDRRESALHGVRIVNVYPALNVQLPERG
jgi:Icc-related predicted phosphoesterase